MDVIGEVQTYIEEFNPESMGLTWDDENPRIELEPIAERGYIELRAVK